jgi:sugar lactone lactonase YvrE
MQFDQFVITVYAVVGKISPPACICAMQEDHKMTSSHKMSDFTVVASGLSYPEGPFWQPDNTLLVCEVGNGQLRRVHLDTGAIDVVAALGGGANGCAVGPDGAIYVCNNGGMLVLSATQSNGGKITLALGEITANYAGGKIQRVDASGKFKDLNDCVMSPTPLVLLSKNGLG